jgi:hypothetical protein
MIATLRILSIALGLALLAFGALGLLISLVFVFSTDARDVLGAAMGFVAGSVMLGAGSITLAICSSGDGTRGEAGRIGPSNG